MPTHATTHPPRRLKPSPSVLPPSLMLGRRSPTMVPALMSLHQVVASLRLGLGAIPALEPSRVRVWPAPTSLELLPFILGTTQRSHPTRCPPRSRSQPHLALWVIPAPAHLTSSPTSSTSLIVLPPTTMTTRARSRVPAWEYAKVEAVWNIVLLPTTMAKRAHSRVQASEHAREYAKKEAVFLCFLMTPQRLHSC